MLVVCLVASLFFVKGQSLLLVPSHQDNQQKLTQCVIEILNKYFSEKAKLTFVNIQSHEEVLLKAIHSTINFTLISRVSTQQMFVPNIEYLVTSENVADFSKYFHYLIQEPKWNPNARFLIIIKSLRDDELKIIFDELLKQHVNNVLIVNGTEDAHLYTYNPFDNFACGRYYNAITQFGKCSQVTSNLYPNKLVTGLRNCNFRASIAHRPPFALDPSKTEDKKKKPLLGLDEYVIELLGEKEHFTVSFNYSTDSEQFSMIAPNMTAIGPMSMLQKNECDIAFGGLMLVASRAEAFSYLIGYYDYGEELVFAVKTASLVPAWKYIYLEFDLEVWILLLIALMVYIVIIYTVLHSIDVAEVALLLLDNLLLHGREIRTRMSVKCLLITWVWFAYLMNTFYQSILFSFITHPVKEYQISSEKDITTYNLMPCFSNALQTYLATENFHGEDINFKMKGCQSTDESINAVSTATNKFTLISTYIYQYNKGVYSDKWGGSLMYYFDKPYTKFLYCFLFYNGFPITESLQLNALRLRESGLTVKRVNEHYTTQRLKNHFKLKTFESHVLIPWCVCIPGFTAAIIAFLLELIFKHPKWSRYTTRIFKNKFAIELC